MSEVLSDWIEKYLFFQDTPKAQRIKEGAMLKFRLSGKDFLREVMIYERDKKFASEENEKHVSGVQQ